MTGQPTVTTREAPRGFLADVMLGKLSRWLRILGYDTAYENHLDDAELVDRAMTEDRWLLTRDRYLVRRRALKGHCTLLASDDLKEQLHQLQREVGLSLDMHCASRCPGCNRVLEDLQPELAKPHVPAYVASRHVRFVRCPMCTRIFWPGSHWDHVRHTLEWIRKA